MSEVLEWAGCHPDMGPSLYHGLIDPGLALPHMRVEVLLAEGGDRCWLNRFLNDLSRGFVISRCHEFCVS
jgi:hypothetical protein